MVDFSIYIHFLFEYNETKMIHYEYSMTSWQCRTGGTEMIITIARQCGSGGHEIGRELASRLGMELYDRKKLEEEARKLGKYDGP